MDHNIAIIFDKLKNEIDFIKISMLDNLEELSDKTLKEKIYISQNNNKKLKEKVNKLVKDVKSRVDILKDLSEISWGSYLTNVSVK